MHAIINGRHYDTALATAIAIEDPLDGSEELYQTRGVLFFLSLTRNGSTAAG